MNRVCMATMAVVGLVLVGSLPACGETDDAALVAPSPAASSPAAMGQSPASVAAAPVTGVTTGAALYQQHCNTCHGTRPDGTAILNADDPAEVAQVIASGQTDMPGFADELDETQIDAIAEFVTD